MEHLLPHADLRPGASARSRLEALRLTVALALLMKMIRRFGHVELADTVEGPVRPPMPRSLFVPSPRNVDNAIQNYQH